MIVVPGSGPVPCDYMIVGEAPGREEARLGRPFTGLSGRELDWYLNRHGLHRSQFYLTNVVKLYQDGNPDPSPELIEEWSADLAREIATVRPRVILPLGRFASRWFLGNSVDMESCRGIPHRGGEFDPMHRDRGAGAIIVPTYHPAYALRSQDAKALINADLGHAADVIRLVQGGRHDLVRFSRDAYEGREDYRDATGRQLAGIIRAVMPRRIGFDTEGTPEEPWSLQVSWEPGTALVLRCGQPDFEYGVRALQDLADSGCVFITHDAGTPRGTGYDTQVARTCGLELRDAEHAHTMYDAYLLRLEPKGLKPLLWRWCGMRQDDYMSLIGDVGREKQIRYLEKVAARKDWARVPARVERENSGVLKVKKFGKLESRAKKILTDIAKDKRNKEGEPPDPAKRWAMLEPELRQIAEAELGRLPYGTLDDVDLERAVWYGARDADGVLRLDTELAQERHRMGTAGVYETGCQVLPIFEEMQHEGMPASRHAFVDLATTVDREMQELQAGLSAKYFDSRPFNPAPNTKDVETLVRRLGITGLKTTKKSGRPSTSMKNLEYLAPKYPALREVGEWRRRQKVLNTYCLPLIEIADRQIEVETRRLGQPEGGDANAVQPMRVNQPSDRRMHSAAHIDGDGSSADLFLVHCKLKPVSVETRRLAAEDPSLLNQPVRTELGRKVRGCYMTVAPEDDDPENPNVEVFGAWDFNSQEVRVAAHVTGDRLLCSIMCDPKRKIHMETASRIFGKPMGEIHEINEKIPAKTAFFGMLYGLSGLGLLDLFRSFGLETWALHDCEKLIGEIFKIYPGLREAIQRAENEARRTGMIRDLYGHIRYLPGIWSGSRGEQSEAARQAFSHVVQGTAQGITQNAMSWLRRPMRELRGLGIKWALQVHDELVIRMPRWAFGVMDRIMREGMEQHYMGPTNTTLSVPVLVDGHTATRWDALK